MSGFKQVTKAQARSHLSRDERIARLEGVILPLQARADYVQEISRLWKDAQNSFLTIGRYLVQAAERLEHGEYQAMVDNELPFGYQVSYQLRKVAEAIDGKRLVIDELPSSYATIYQLTTLSDEQLEEARRQQPPLIRPSVKRQEIVAFKRELTRAKSIQPQSPSRRLAQLQKRKQALQAQQERIARELEEIELELSGF